MYILSVHSTHCTPVVYPSFSVPRLCIVSCVLRPLCGNMFCGRCVRCVGACSLCVRSRLPLYNFTLYLHLAA